MKTIKTLALVLTISCALAFAIFPALTSNEANANSNTANIASLVTKPAANLKLAPKEDKDDAKYDCNVPATPAAINGSPVVCADLPGNYSIAAVAGATSYVWTVVGGHVTTTNLNKTAVTIKWGLLAKSVSVKAVNNCGSSGTRTLTITRVIPKCL